MWRAYAAAMTLASFPALKKLPNRQKLELAVTGHFKTSHLGSPKNQPPQNVESKEHFFSNKLHISR